jgi:hypothetical protein
MPTQTKLGEVVRSYTLSITAPWYAIGVRRKGSRIPKTHGVQRSDEGSWNMLCGDGAIISGVIPEGYPEREIEKLKCAECKRAAKHLANELAARNDLTQPDLTTVPKKAPKPVVTVTSSSASFAGVISGGQSYSPAEIDEATAIRDDMRKSSGCFVKGGNPVMIAAIIRDVRNSKTLEPQEDRDRAPKYPHGDSLGLGSSQGILVSGWEYVSAEIAEADFLCYKHVFGKDKDTVISVAVLVRRIRAAEFRLKHQIRLDLGKIEISPDGNSAFADSVIHIDGSSQMSTCPIRIGPSIVHHWKDTRGAQLARQFNVATSVLCAAVADVIRPFEEQVWMSLPAEAAE